MRPAINDHRPGCFAYGVRNLTDWQANEGAVMDANTTFHPYGAHETCRHESGKSVWFTRSGYVLAKIDPGPAREEVYVELRGRRYRVIFERSAAMAEGCTWAAPHTSEIREVRPGARPLRPLTILHRNLERLALRRTM